MTYFWAFIAVFLFSSSALLKKNLQTAEFNLSRKDIFLLEYAGCFLIYFIYAVIDGKIIPPETEHLFWLMLHAVIWGSFSYINLFCLKNLQASNISVIESSKFIWILLASIFIFAEDILIYDLIGLAIIVLSIFLTSRENFKSPSSYRIFYLTLFNTGLLSAGIILDKYLCVIGVPLEIILISVCLLPTLFIVSKSKLSIPKAIKRYNLNPVVYILPVLEAAAFALILYIFAAGGSLLSVSIILELQCLALLIFEYILIKSRINLTNRLAFTCLNIVGVSLVLF